MPTTPTADHQDAFNRAVDARVRVAVPQILADIFNSFTVTAVELRAARARRAGKKDKAPRCARSPHMGRCGKKCREAAEASK